MPDSSWFVAFFPTPPHFSLPSTFKEEGGVLDRLSMAANGGLTDAEGAMSDVNSMYECGDMAGEDAELDDTSLSSRASSRIFDSDQIYSADSLHGM